MLTKGNIKALLLKLIPESLKHEIIKPYLQANTAYSQEGEDLLLMRLFDKKKSGFYVDVGAHHPTRFSNTFLFYQKGWRGINIDAMPGSMKLFNELRPEDINIEVGIGSQEGSSIYYIFNEPALNTFSNIEAKKKATIPGYKILEEQKLQIKTLSSLLNEYLPVDQEIDFLSIDVEGKDFDVLISNDWNKFRPRIILVEDLARVGIREYLQSSEVYNFLVEKDYKLLSKLMNTLIFESNI